MARSSGPPETNKSDAESRTRWQDELVFCISQFRKDQLRTLLEDCKQPTTGTKSELLKQLRDALFDSLVSEKVVFDFLDAIEPLDKQQVFLFSGPEGNLESFSNASSFAKKIHPYSCSTLLGKPLSLLLPEELTLSSIMHHGHSLEIRALHRRDAVDRRPDLDKVASENDETILYQAYHRTSTRGLVRFRWNFAANTATLQISQLPSRGNYDKELLAFSELVSPWLDINLFSPIDLSLAIGEFHAKEGTQFAETRSQEIDYSVEGRRVSGRAATAKDPLLGVQVVDKALSSFRKTGVGYSGNFYFQSTDTNPIPDGQEVHVHILAEKDRVRFFTANTEENFSYVLQRIRAASQR